MFSALIGSNIRRLTWSCLYGLQSCYLTFGCATQASAWSNAQRHILLIGRTSASLQPRAVIRSHIQQLLISRQPRHRDQTEGGKFRMLYAMS
jgi:hypothetical protein